MKTQAHTDAGITVGLIDSMLTIAKVLNPRLKRETFGEPRPTVREALKDLHSDPDLLDILTTGPYNPYVMRDGPEIRAAVERAIAPYKDHNQKVLNLSREYDITLQICSYQVAQFIPRTYLLPESKLFTHNGFFTITRLISEGNQLGLDGTDIRITAQRNHDYTVAPERGDILKICHFLPDLIVI